MSENFVDTFGFEDGAFNENADDDNNEMRRLTNVLSDQSSLLIFHRISCYISPLNLLLLALKIDLTAS